jgi:hypothetical protein
VKATNQAKLFASACLLIVFVLAEGTSAAEKTLRSPVSFSGLIDDLKIYDRAVTP